MFRVNGVLLIVIKEFFSKAVVFFFSKDSYFVSEFYFLKKQGLIFSNGFEFYFSTRSLSFLIFQLVLFSFSKGLFFPCVCVFFSNFFDNKVFFCFSKAVVFLRFFFSFTIVPKTFFVFLSFIFDCFFFQKNVFNVAFLFFKVFFQRVFFSLNGFVPRDLFFKNFERSLFFSKLFCRVFFQSFFRIIFSQRFFLQRMFSLRIF